MPPSVKMLASALARRTVGIFSPYWDRLLASCLSQAPRCDTSVVFVRHNVNVKEPNHLSPVISDMKNGLYSIHIQMLDGVKGRASGVLVFRDGTILGGDPYFWSAGSYTVRRRHLEGRDRHQPAHALSRNRRPAGIRRPRGLNRLFRNVRGRHRGGIRHLAGRQPQRQFSRDIAPASR